MIVADLGRAALLSSVPAAALLGILRIEQLYIVAFLAGTFSMFFNAAYGSFIPSVVPREDLAEGNGKLAASRAFARTIGPSLGGVLIQVATAPIAMAVDALSFVASALFLGGIRAAEAVPNQTGRNVRREVAEGLRLVLSNPVLRSTLGAGAMFNFFAMALIAVYMLYVTRDLRIAPGVLGVIFTVGLAPSTLAALLTSRLTRRLGFGRTQVLGLLLLSVSQLCVPVAAYSGDFIVFVLILGRLLSGLGLPLYDVNLSTIVQLATPPTALGRVNATQQVVVMGVLPLGALAGGALGEAIGIRPTLFLAVAGGFLATGWLAYSPAGRAGGLSATS